MNRSARFQVIYSGHVHGVGFRFTARSIALRLNLTGFVKNLPNGTVEVVCEGEKKSLEEFLNITQENLAGYIGDSCIKWEPSRGEFTSFEIRF